MELSRMIVTDTGLPNVPNEQEKVKLEWLWDNILAPLELGIGDVDVTSAFRCDEVNKKVGGVSTSQHRLAEAIDFIPKKVSLDFAFQWCKTNMIFGQLIKEHSGNKEWIHISRPRVGKPNQQALRMEDGKYYPA